MLARIRFLLKYHFLRTDKKIKDSETFARGQSQTQTLPAGFLLSAQQIVPRTSATNTVPLA